MTTTKRNESSIKPRILTVEMLERAGACEGAVDLVRAAGGSVDLNKLTGNHTYLTWLKNRTFDSREPLIRVGTFNDPFSDKGLLVWVKYSDGRLEKDTFDRKDCLVRVEYFDGEWMEKTFDGGGRLVRVEYSDGEWMEYGN